MKFSFRGFGKRAISTLLMLLMMLSVCVVGITSASAAETEIAEVGWSTSDTFYCLSGLNASSPYDIVDSNKMTKDTTNKKYQTIYTGVSTAESFYFRLYDGNQYLIPYNTTGRTIKPEYETGYDINQQNDQWGFKTASSHGDNTWEFAMDNLSTNYSTVTVYIEFQINSSGGGYIHLWVTDGVAQSSGGDTGAKYALCGDIGGGWGTYSASNLVNGTTDTENVYSKQITTTADNKYFRLVTSNGTQYKPAGSSSGVDYDVSGCSTSATAKATEVGSDGAFKIATAGTYTIYVDQTNTPPSVWVESNGSGSGSGSGSGGGSTGDTKTVYIGLIYDFLDNHFMPTLHWWNNSNNGDVSLTATDESADFSLGSSYFDGVAQTFNIYTAEVPSNATGMKTFKQGTSNTNWAAEDVTIADGTILLCFHYGNAYHNLSAEYAGGSGSTTLGDFWVDTNTNFGDDDPETNDIDLLVPEKSGTTYKLYLPSGVDRTAVPFYFACENLSINGTAVTSGDTVDLSGNSAYTLSGDITGSLYVYQSQGVATFYTSTKKSMPTTTGAYASKDDYSTSGTYMKADAEGAVELDEANLKKVKGRGNSSWSASYQVFGKYSYNITLESKAKLVAGGQKCKKYSVLANNADEARMRNMVIYSLSNAIGINYTTKFEQVDMYNNHRYMGSYMICYKVEIGNPLVDIYDLEGANEELAENAFVYTDENYSQGYSGGSGVNDNSTKNFYKYINNMATPEYYQGGYLLEFELNERFADELCGFISSQGQQIVCKYPEFCSKTEVQFIRDKWNEAEALMYSTSATYEELDAVMDVESFAKMYLIQELSKNLDGCATSYYVSYDKDGKFRASCTWDYDWTLGQYGSNNQKAIVTSGKASWLGTCNANVNDATGWFEAVKAIYGTTDTRNAQAALCQNSAFWNVVKTEWNELFYDTASTYCTSGTVSSASNLSGVINQYYNQIKSSIDMDEVRWGFIASDPITSWGSANTGANFDAATVALNNWYYTRLAWMNQYLDSNTYTLATPTLTASATEYTVGEEVTLIAECNSAGTITYTIYDSNDLVVGTVTSDNGTAEYTFTATAPGTFDYYVKATTSNTVNTSSASDTASVLVNDFDLIVSLTAKNTNVEAGYSIKLTATSNALDTATYTLYEVGNSTPITANTTGVFTVATSEDDVDTTKSYYVVASTTYNAETYTKDTSATPVVISIIPVQEQYTVNVYFKSTGTYGYAPHLTTKNCINNVTGEEMARTAFIGKNKTQTASYYWYTATVEVSKASTSITLRFESDRYSMDGSITLSIDHSGDYYFGIDNLNSGTKVENLTEKSATERNWYQSAAHMVYDSKYDGVLSVSANVELAYIGDVNCDGKINIKDATFIQKAIAGIVTLDDVGTVVADVDGDGAVTIKDATLLSKQIAGVL